MSYYLSYLIMKLVPFTGVDRRGFARYSDDIFASTSIDRSGAALLISHINPILSGTDIEKPVQAVLPCLNGTSLTFEYRPDENKQMSAYLIISKNYTTIPFKFSTAHKNVYENGQMVTKVEQVDLAAFLRVLEGFIKK